MPRFFLAALLTVFAAGIGLKFSGNLAQSLNDGTHEMRILSGYLAASGAHVSTAFLWLPFLGAWLLLTERIVLMRWSIPRKAVIPALLLWLALPAAAKLNAHKLRHNQGFWTPIALSDIRAFRRIESLIPKGDAVIVPVEHWNIAEWEHWVIPQGPGTSLLPYGERKYLFNVYLGASYPFSWRDLEDRLCSRDSEVRQKFLATAGARWLLLRDPKARDHQDAIARASLCHRPLGEHAFELVPEKAEAGIFLFRIGG